MTEEEKTVLVHRPRLLEIYGEKGFAEQLAAAHVMIKGFQKEMPLWTLDQIKVIYRELSDKNKTMDLEERFIGDFFIVLAIIELKYKK